MNDKISAMIAFVSFSAAAAAHVAILPALIAFEITKDSTVAFWVYVASFLPVMVVCGGVLLAALRAVINAAKDPPLDYEWITVSSDNGQKRKVRVPKVYNMGKRDHEAEQLFRDK